MQFPEDLLAGKDILNVLDAAPCSEILTTEQVSAEGPAPAQPLI
jgi:hypothetical protein